MKSFIEYRKNLLKESIEGSDDFATAFDGHFDFFKLELLESLEVPLLLSESVENALLKFVAERASEEDRDLCAQIIRAHLPVLYSECTEIVTEAGEALDMKTASERVKQQIAAKIKELFTDLKKSVGAAIGVNRSAVVPPEAAGFSAPGSDSEQVPASTAPNGSQVTPGSSASPTSSTSPTSPTAPAVGGTPPANGQRPAAGAGKGFWGWLKSFLSPTAWKNWTKSREGMSKLQDLIAHGKVPDDFINKHWDQNFKQEDAWATYDVLQEHLGDRTIQVMNTIDEFGNRIVRFINSQIDSFVTQSSTSAAPVVAPVAGAPVSTEKPVAPTEIPSKEPRFRTEPSTPATAKDAEEFGSPAVAPEPEQTEEEPEEIVPDQRSAGAPPKDYLAENPEKLKAEFLSQQTSTRRQQLEKGITERYLTKLPASPQGRSTLKRWAEALGYDRLPPSTRIGYADWIPVLNFLTDAFKHLGLWDDSAPYSRIVTAGHKGRPSPRKVQDQDPGVEVPVPGEKPAPGKPVAHAATAAAPTAVPPKKEPVTSFDDIDHNSDHASMSDENMMDMITILQQLKKEGVTDETRAVKALRHYYDQNKLTNLKNTSDIVKGVKELMGVKSEPTVEPSAEEPEASVEEPTATEPNEPEADKFDDSGLWRDIEAQQDEPEVEEEPEVEVPAEEKPEVEPAKVEPKVTAPPAPARPRDPNEKGTPADVRKVVFPTLKAELQGKYQPFVSDDNINKFLSNVDVSDQMGEEDIDFIVDDLADYLDINISKIEDRKANRVVRRRPESDEDE